MACQAESFKKDQEANFHRFVSVTHATVYLSEIQLLEVKLEPVDFK